MTEKPEHHSDKPEDAPRGWTDGDVEKLLALAEQIQQESELEESRLERYRFIQYLTIGLAILGALIAWSLVAGNSSSLFPPYVGSILIVIVGASYVIFFQRYIVRIRRRLEVNHRSLSEIVQFLRETEGMIVKDQSPFDQAHFRIRLARFGIGSDSKRWIF
jgi:hypothetical protein